LFAFKEMRNVLEERIKDVMAKVFGVSADAIGAATSSQTVERWDSLGHMNLCLALEEEFGIELDVEQVSSMTSYEQVVTAVGTALGQ
jgi:acyl carrier protein